MSQANMYDWIRRAPTSIDAEDMRRYLADGCKGVHESVLQGYQILSKVKQLLDAGVPAAVVRELIELMETPLGGRS